MIQIPYYGLKLDLSTAGYFSAFAFLIVTASVFLKNSITYSIIKVYTLAIIIVTNLLALTDMGLYGPWGVKLDSTLLMYINTPFEMLASVSNAQLLLGTIAWILSSFLFFKSFKWIFKKMILQFPKAKYAYSLALIVFVPALILPIRGGIQPIPINQSNVYFSDQMFANHASVNFVWSFMDSASKRVSDDHNPYIQFDPSLAQDLIQTSNSNISDASVYDASRILNTTTPNVILIVWESLTAKIVEPLGGDKDVTRNFNLLTKEGIFFSNFYANGDRSDKGLVAILSGYYPQLDRSIIKMTNKIQNLPMLPREMMELGYQPSFYYGGDMNFGNMNTYFRTSGVNNIIDGDSFDKSDWNNKWGAHDHVVLERFIENHKTKRDNPFFSMVFTLSSHEPFEVPGEYKFGKGSEDDKFRSAHAYTDKAFGDFIISAKTQWWWDNTLIVVMADHGNHRPQREGIFNQPSRFHIPMLWLGGAVATQDTIVDHYASQIDFSKTILNLLDGNSEGFVWSNDLFLNSGNHYAHYIFNKGFGTLNKQGNMVYDYTSGSILNQEGNDIHHLDSLGKSITQESYQDFLNR